MTLCCWYIKELQNQQWAVPRIHPHRRVLIMSWRLAKTILPVPKSSGLPPINTAIYVGWNEASSDEPTGWYYAIVSKMAKPKLSMQTMHLKLWTLMPSAGYIPEWVKKHSYRFPQTVLNSHWRRSVRKPRKSKFAYQYTTLSKALPTTWWSSLPIFQLTVLHLK